MTIIEHQYIDRTTSAVITERFYGDRLVNWAYASPWENASWFFRVLSSARTSRVLSFFNYDLPFGSAVSGAHRFARAVGLDLSECLDRPEQLNTPRKAFERKLRYWDVRQMEEDPMAVASPADARLLIGSFADTSQLFLKNKFFSFEELLGIEKPEWHEAFRGGDFAIFRLTPEKYHYNHVPVAGTVLDIYEIAGAYHSCNPGTVISIAAPYSKNRRVVTVLDTDVPNGTHVGLVAMIEIVALMIGHIDQCYSDTKYDSPRDVMKGMFLRKGQPKSLYRPGSSTDVLIFQPDRVALCQDLIRNMYRLGVQSRFSHGFGRPLVETDVKVRSTIARARQGLQPAAPTGRHRHDQ